MATEAFWADMRDELDMDKPLIRPIYKAVQNGRDYRETKTFWAWAFSFPQRYYPGRRYLFSRSKSLDDVFALEQYTEDRGTFVGGLDGTWYGMLVLPGAILLKADCDRRASVALRSWRSAAGRKTAEKLGPDGRAARAKAGAAKRWGVEWAIRIEDRSESGQSSAPILYAATRRAASPEAALVAALKSLRKAGVNFRRHAGPSGDRIDPASDSYFGLAGSCVAVVSPAEGSTDEQD